MRAATSLLATALLLGASVPAFAADITIRDFAGRITLVEGTDGVSVDQVGRYPADFSSNRDSIVVDGGLSSKQRDKACRGESGLVVRINGRDRVPDKRLRDYPALTIAVPQGSTLTVRDSTIRFLSEVDLSTADIDMGGCFDIRLANVDDLRLDKSGSWTGSASPPGSTNPAPAISRSTRPSAISPSTSRAPAMWKCRAGSCATSSSAIAAPATWTSKRPWRTPASTRPAPATSTWRPCRACSTRPCPARPNSNAETIRAVG
jgi:hypothetical protein